MLTTGNKTIVKPLRVVWQKLDLILLIVVVLEEPRQADLFESFDYIFDT
jgi:hypothetical protein